QGRLWAMHDVLFENQEALGGEDLVGYASALGLDESRFVGELTEHVHAARVREDFVGGVRSGVNGTPTFFINEGRHDGPFGLDSLLGAVEAEIAAATGRDGSDHSSQYHPRRARCRARPRRPRAVDAQAPPRPAALAACPPAPG